MHLQIIGRIWRNSLWIAGMIAFVTGRYGMLPMCWSDAVQSKDVLVTSIPFGESNGADVYNASGVVPLADSRFLFCDNNTGNALFELDLTPDGQKKGPIIPRPLKGLAPGAIDDLEALAQAEERQTRFIFATSSLSLKKSKNGGPPQVRPSGVLRVKVNADNSLTAENMPGFRNWFLRHQPELAAAANALPDEGGLNVEGLAWDPGRHALLFGIRTPLVAGKLLLVPVRIKNLTGEWTTRNLEMLPVIRLPLDLMEGRGIRSLEYIPSRHSFLATTGRALSGVNVPFNLCEWSGKASERMHRLPVSFTDKMKPEGLTSGTIGGRPILLFMDDGGGFQVLWLDEMHF